MAVEHEDVILELAEHLRPLFEASPDGVYIWLDEHHSSCNERLANTFGGGHTVAYHFVRQVGE